jgi:hypothetical protein
MHLLKAICNYDCDRMMWLGSKLKLRDTAIKLGSWPRRCGASPILFVQTPHYNRSKMDGAARLPIEAWYLDVPPVTRAFVTASVLTSIAVVCPRNDVG